MYRTSPLPKRIIANNTFFFFPNTREDVNYNDGFLHSLWFSFCFFFSFSFHSIPLFWLCLCCIWFIFLILEPIALVSVNSYLSFYFDIFLAFVYFDSNYNFHIISSIGHMLCKIQRKILFCFIFFGCFQFYF